MPGKMDEEFIITIMACRGHCIVVYSGVYW